MNLKSVKELASAVNNTAEAIKDVANVADKSVDSLKRVGSFIAKLTSGTIEQGMGIFEDKLRYLRWERQVRYMEQASIRMQQIGLSEPNRLIPLKFALPLFESVSLEEDDDLQDLWINLLVNAANKDSGVSLQRVYIDMLQNMSSLDVQVLQKIYALPYEDVMHEGIVTADLPNSARVRSKFDGEKMSEPSQDVVLSLANLERLGCLSVSTSMGGGQYFYLVNPTLLGKKFVEACTLQALTSGN